MKRIAEIMVMFVLAGMVFTGCKQNASSPKEKEKPLPEGVDGRFKLHDYYSYNLDDYQFMTMTDEKLSFVYEIELNNPGDTYIILNTDMNNQMRYACNKKTGLRCDCVFTLRDSEGNAVEVLDQQGSIKQDGKTDDQAFSFICPEEKGTYYLEIIPYNIENRGNVGLYLYHGKPISDFTLDLTNVTVGVGNSVNVPFTYTSEDATDSYGFYFFAVPYGSSDNMTDYIISSTCVVNKDGTGYVTVYGIIPGNGSFRIKEGVSGIERNCNVSVYIDTTAFYESIPCGTSLSPSDSDFTVVNSEGYVQSKLYELNLTKDVNYMIDYLSSWEQSYWYVLYDSTGSKLVSAINDKLCLRQETSGKYYLLVKNYDTYSDGVTGVYLHSVTAISSLQFANAQETLKIGESKTMNASYTGSSDFSLAFEIENNNEQVYIERIDNNGDGTVSVKLVSLGPVDSDIYLVEKVSCLRTRCRIKAEFISSDAIPINSSAIGNQSSVNQNDYTKSYLDRRTAVYYKLELEADKEYHLEVFDNCAYKRFFSEIPDGFSLTDGLFYMYDSQGNIVTVNDKDNIRKRFDGSDNAYDGYYTPSASGTYYLLLTLYNPESSGEGDVYFHIYKAD